MREEDGMITEDILGKISIILAVLTTIGTAWVQVVHWRIIAHPQFGHGYVIWLFLAVTLFGMMVLAAKELETGVEYIEGEPWYVEPLDFATRFSRRSWLAMMVIPVGLYGVYPSMKFFGMTSNLAQNGDFGILITQSILLVTAMVVLTVNFRVNQGKYGWKRGTAESILVFFILAIVLLPFAQNSLVGEVPTNIEALFATSPNGLSETDFRSLLSSVVMLGIVDIGGMVYLSGDNEPSQTVDIGSDEDVEDSAESTKFTQIPVVHNNNR